jgi:dienelactone hydrolase
MPALEKIPYSDRDIPLTGWLARPEGQPRGAVAIFPTIMNVNGPMIRRAQMLADAGYVAFIADFYGEEVRDFEHSLAMGRALREDVDHYRARLIAAVATLRAHPAAAGLSLAAIGYCMGGQAALELTRAGEDLVLAASFHGILESGRPATAETPIATRILVCHGDADPLVPRTQVMAFWEEMDAARANWHFHSYAAVRHGFTDPKSGERGLPSIAYDASADRQSWSALISMFDEVFG